MRGGTYYSSNPFWSKKRNVYKERESKLLKTLGLVKTRKGFLDRHKSKAAEPESSDSESEAENPNQDQSQSPQPKKFKRGACTNCGSTLHKRRDCVERPRRVKAKHSINSIKGNEQIDKRRLKERQKNKQEGYDAKRDHWAGYDPENYNEKVIEFQLEEDIKGQLGLGKGEDEYKEVVEDNAFYLSKNDDTREKNYHSLRQRENVPKYLLEWKLENEEKKLLEENGGKKLSEEERRKIREKILQLDHNLSK